MPANDIAAWTDALLAQLARSRQRQLLWLRGPRDWCERQFADLARRDSAFVVFSDTGLSPHAVPRADAAGCLGGEALFAVVDLAGGLDPDLLCVAAGLVTGGGLLVLLGDDDDLPGNFGAYFRDALGGEAGIGLVVAPGKPLTAPPPLPALAPTAIVDGCTAEQRAALAAIERWLAEDGAPVGLLSAERGRGKSTCLGLLAARLAARCRVLVSARSRQAAAVLLARAPAVEFVAPDRLLERRPAAELVIVDEAATLPLAMLRRIRRAYPRLLMATTTGGYEGTGSGFRVRFVAELERDGLTAFALHHPVRWCAGDRLEAWINRCLVPDSPAADAASAPEPGALTFAVRGSAQLPLALDAHALLASAHYRTRPSDLRRLMDEPGQWLVVALCGDTLVGVAWLTEEGGFDAVLCEQVFFGRRRPPGHLLAQMLTAQAGCRGFARHRGLRIQRIAVAVGWRRRGIGLGLVERALEHGRETGADYLGASFAIDPQSAPFWRRAGFRLVHVGFAPGKSSGNHSVAVLRPIGAALDADIAVLLGRVARGLPLWVTQFLQSLDARELAALLRLADWRGEPDACESDEVEAFAHGNRGFELGFVSLQRFVMRQVARTAGEPSPLLLAKAVQNRPWSQLERESAGEGRKQLRARLRRRVAELTESGRGGPTPSDCASLARRQTPTGQRVMPQDVLDFWFAEETRKRWFDSTPAFDRELTERFEHTWERARDGELDHWMQSADGCLALVIVLDQFPLNMYRGSARGFSTEARSREVAQHAIDRGFDREIDISRLAFLYLPFMHSERLEDQQRALELFDRPGLEQNLRFARHHHDLIARFGRFPHRNAALGRTSTPEEREYLASDEAFTG